MKFVNITIGDGSGGARGHMPPPNLEAGWDMGGHTHI